MHPSAKDLLRIVEAAYRIDVADHEWLESIALACKPALDEGLGISAFEFRYQVGSLPQILQTKRIGVPDDVAKLHRVVFESLPADFRQAPFTRGPCITASQIVGLRGEANRKEVMHPLMQQHGLYDAIWVTALEPSGWGCGLRAGRSRVRWASRATAMCWARVAAHLSAAARLRRRHIEKNTSNHVDRGGMEAVFSPNGRIHHAEGPANSSGAIEQLRQSVRALEATRHSMHEEDATTCLKMRQGLVNGRWSLIDHFESDGKRYIVAKENAPTPPEAGALTLRERQIVGYAALGHENKVIAYDLGIAHATVRVLMARAAAKLGAQSRAELISKYRVCAAGKGDMGDA